MKQNRISTILVVSTIINLALALFTTVSNLPVSALLFFFVLELWLLSFILIWRFWYATPRPVVFFNFALLLVLGSLVMHATYTRVYSELYGVAPDTLLDPAFMAATAPALIAIVCSAIYTRYRTTRPAAGSTTPLTLVFAPLLVYFGLGSLVLILAFSTMLWSYYTNLILIFLAKELCDVYVRKLLN